MYVDECFEYHFVLAGVRRIFENKSQFNLNQAESYFISRKCSLVLFIEIRNPCIAIGHRLCFSFIQEMQNVIKYEDKVENNQKIVVIGDLLDDICYMHSFQWK